MINYIPCDICRQSYIWAIMWQKDTYVQTKSYNSICCPYTDILDAIDIENTDKSSGLDNFFHPKDINILSTFSKKHMLWV